MGCKLGRGAASVGSIVAVVAALGLLGCADEATKEDGLGGEPGTGGTSSNGGSSGATAQGGSAGADGAQGGSAGTDGAQGGSAGTDGAQGGSAGTANGGSDQGGASGGGAGGSGPGPGSFTLQGAVQKGPFIQGSSITISLLDADLDPTGQNFSTATINDVGEFTANNLPQQPLGLSGEGFYYNELTGNLSGAELTLRGVFVPSAGATQSAYVNIITHLTNQRVRALVKSGSPFSGAVTQAEQELMVGLGLTLPSFNPNATGVQMNLAGGDSDANAYLFGVSSTIVQTAQDEPGNSLEAKLQELLNVLAADLEDGTLSSANTLKIRSALARFDVDVLAARFRTRLDQLGSSSLVPDMNRVLDQDRDGLVNALDNCPRLANAEQLDGDADGVGNACDACPDLVCEHQCLPDAIPFSAGGQEPTPADFCFKACQPFDDANQCADDEICVFLEMLADSGNSFPDPSAGMCVPSCNPLAPDCTGDEACLAQGTYGGEIQWRCVVPESGAGDEGSICHGDDCAESLACVFDEGLQNSVCRRVCTSESTCEGRACLPSGLDSNLCDLPPPDLGDACAPGGAACSAGECGSCGSAGGSCCTDPGAQGQPCNQDNSCDPGLGCVNDYVACDEFDECCLPVGGDGEACDQGETCDSGLTCVLSLDDHCGDGLSECCLPAGAEGQPCDDNACDIGLSCVNVGPVGGACGDVQCCMAAGAENQPCDENQCNSGLACVNTGPQSLCGASECCLPAGGENQPCDDNQCDAGLACVNGGSACGDFNECCVPAGGENQPCDDNQCSAGLACVFGGSTCDGPGACCLPAGGENQPCDDNQCDAGLACVNGGSACGDLNSCCLPAGGEGQACNDNHCDPGLACTFGGPACGDLSTCCLPAGGENQACNDNECNTGLACVFGASACGDLNECCVPAGGENQPCDDNQCGAGLTCVSVSACGSLSECCMPTGGEGQPCEGNQCDAGLACVFGASACGELNECCVAAGDEGQPCIGNQCSAGLACVEGSSECEDLDECCLPTGGEGQPCGAGGTCDEDLTCAPDDEPECSEINMECCIPG